MYIHQFAYLHVFRAMAAVDEGATNKNHLMFDAKEAPWGGLFFIGNALFRFPPKDPFIHAVHNV